MLPLLKTDRKPQKCQISYGQLPTFIDPKQPPQRRKPFDALWALKWCHTVDVLLPVELRDVIQQAEGRQNELGRLETRNERFAKVIMKLGEVLEGDFFTEYVKKGNVLMLSEGRQGVDTVYALHDGILTIQVDRPTYERLGLQGRPLRDGGLRHKKNRFLIELNLRLPSMLHGKKGFERLIWACKNVLVESVTWLFYDCQPRSSSSDSGPAPIDIHHPLWHTLRPSTTTHTNILIPPLSSSTIASSAADLKDASIAGESYLADLEEYFSLLCLSSLRLRAGEKIDPFLSRYEVPRYEPLSNDGASAQADLRLKTGDVLQHRYRGFVPAAHVVRDVVLLTKGLTARSLESDMKDSDRDWGVIQARGFGGECVTILVGGDGSDKSINVDTTHDGAENMSEDEGSGDTVNAGAAGEANTPNKGGVMTSVGNEARAHPAAAAAAPSDEKKDGQGRESRAAGSWFVCWEHAASV